MFALAISFFVLLNGNEALPAQRILPTPAPLSPSVINLSPIDTSTTPEHVYDGPSKADIIIAATDHTGTVFDDIAKEFDKFFTNLAHLTHPETTNFPQTTPLPRLQPETHNPETQSELPQSELPQSELPQSELPQPKLPEHNTQPKPSDHQPKPSDHQPKPPDHHTQPKLPETTHT
jgi:hypothetical protein